jgi:hypothetical protein
VEDELFHVRGRAGGQAGKQTLQLTAAFGKFANAPENHHPSVSFLYVSVNEKLQCELFVS